MGTKALEFGWSIEQTGSRQQGSVGSPRKIGEGDTGEYSVRGGIGRIAREVTTHGTGETELSGRPEDRFGRELTQGGGVSGQHH